MPLKPGKAVPDVDLGDDDMIAEKYIREPLRSLWADESELADLDYLPEKPSAT